MVARLLLANILGPINWNWSAISYDFDGLINDCMTENAIINVMNDIHSKVVGHFEVT